MYTLMMIFVFLHILCWAGAFGMWIAAAKTREPLPGMAHMSAAAPVLGLIAAVIGIIDGMAINHIAIGIKLVLSVVVAACAFMAVKKREATPAPVWFAIPVGIVVNIAIGVFM
ncbi:hypothetical protein M3B90_08800 [Dermabacter sp. p3-SID358]|uniref:hypothetical protein n=1 Tax=Dermabacter sp. p3-SID358 TaxID=2916114 RepID=UPI0021A57287|nr:hypothetical protein [Dermabacter sp. p3-SID358]MCT1867624.1 hypothetical protein [Dermabacter sp. p3-SID358]